MATSAALLELATLGRQHPGRHGVVSVHDLGFAHSIAACSCGWAGRRRYLKAAAEQDAWTHSMHDHCTVSTPLVLTW
jgi:hypothetical protein